MAEPAMPTEPDRYPHCDGVEGMQTYWDGSSWTGESRYEPTRVSVRGIGSRMVSGLVRGAFGLAWGLIVYVAVMIVGSVLTVLILDLIH